DDLLILIDCGPRKPGAIVERVNQVDALKGRRKPSPTDNAIGDVPGQRSTHLCAEDRIGQRVIHHGIRMRVGMRVGAVYVVIAVEVLAGADLHGAVAIQAIVSEDVSAGKVPSIVEVLKDESIVAA